MERVAGAARAMSEEGYELGVAVAQHLSLVEMLSLPPSVDGIEEYLRSRLVGGNRYLRTTAALADFSEWREENLDPNELLWDAADFWSHLDLAIERHVEAAAPEQWTDENGAIYLCFWGTVESGQWEHHDTPSGWWVPGGSAEIGRYFIAEASLPSAYMRGIAGALTDIRHAVTGVSDAEPSDHRDPGSDSADEGTAS